MGVFWTPGALRCSAVSHLIHRDPHQAQTLRAALCQHANGRVENVSFSCASASGITVRTKEDAVLFIFFIRWCYTFDIWLCIVYGWPLTLIWISQHWNLTLHILQARKGGQFQWTSTDLILWAPLVNDLCVTFFFFFFVTMPTVPKAERTCALRVFKSQHLQHEGMPTGSHAVTLGDLHVERGISLYLAFK